MITEDYVSFETAKLLREKGMDESCFKHYVQKNNNDRTSEAVTVCTLQMAMKWLRKIHNLYIQTEITSWPQKGYFVKIYLYKDWYNNFEEIPFVDHKKSYEEACEVAIKYCLEKLI